MEIRVTSCPRSHLTKGVGQPSFLSPVSTTRLARSVLSVTPHLKAKTSRGQVCLLKYLSPKPELLKPPTSPNTGDIHLPPAPEASPVAFHGDQSEEERARGGAAPMPLCHLGAPRSSRPAVETREVFSQSSVALHMVEIKGVAGCMVLLYFQALLLIRKQDQRQY